ncbi:PA2778 family cysteine peptidase [Candidatus Sulfurimonas baltica]|uniref:PA2778 family cysteine peptidase n=1 Tax=Candidatus Sulfurimonas baltica TaxID=2740404 RepID=A0A7S7LT24_9BACT|nr:PA2778 family cysteine peptidase [Candidatus Sulfurimonas baltica]QOY51046.1 PA2778 family cysteine peptidase [Candidatus Sulfurimonas baltica]
MNNISKSLSLIFAAATLIISSGCVPKNPLPLGNNYQSSSINIPFISPRSNLCGSTSIEMVSSFWQSTTSYVPHLTLEELDERTLIPEKGGTLQIELISAARANGMIAYPLEPTFDALFSELSQHHPVIVLVNRSYSWYPLWHYSPITGYDAIEEKILMHFADKANEAVPIGTFAALWERSGNWGVVLLPPQELPATASPKKFLHSAYDLEKTGMRDEAIIAYKSALIRWPEDVGILFALGNAYYSSQQINNAEQIYREILLIDFTHPITLNNLADLLYHTGRPVEALKLLDKAVTDDIEIESIIKATREEIIKGCIF